MTAYNEESIIQKGLEKALKAIGVFVIRSRMDKRTTNQKGVPDFLFAYRGTPYALEIKRPGKMASAEQLTVLTMLARNGWRVAVLDNVQAAIDFVQTKQ